MNTSSKKSFWFPAKKFGWGWGAPVTWQGWAVMIGYILLAVLGAVRLRTNWPLRFSYLIALSAILIFICWLKGEKPGWRSGKR